MLDTRVALVIKPCVEWLAKRAASCGVTANMLTGMALTLGLTGSVLIASQNFLMGFAVFFCLGCLMLWMVRWRVLGRLRHGAVF